MSDDDRVLDEEAVIQQCGDWTFVLELLQDLLNEKDENFKSLRANVNDAEVSAKDGVDVGGAPAACFATASLSECQANYAILCAR